MTRDERKYIAQARRRAVRTARELGRAAAAIDKMLAAEAAEIAATPYARYLDSDRRGEDRMVRFIAPSAQPWPPLRKT